MPWALTSEIGMRRKSKGCIIIWKVNIVHCSFLNLPSPSALLENFAISSTGSLVVLGGGQLFSGTSSHTLRPLLEALGLGQYREGKGNSISGDTFITPMVVTSASPSQNLPFLRPCSFCALQLSQERDSSPSCSLAGPLLTSARVIIMHYSLECHSLLKSLNAFLLSWKQNPNCPS